MDDKREDLPHWVLSAMKCLANWPRQLRTVNGRESCLPSYPGFEQDVFNVVKDYFLDLKEPLTTFGLYDHFLEAHIKAEAVAAIPRQVVAPPPAPPTTRPPHQQVAGAGQFYTMSEADSEEFLLMSNQERTAKIKATFSCLPPLATSSVKAGTGSSNNSSSTPNSSSLSPDMSTTAIMRTFLPPNSCFETVFLGNSPVTRIVPQAESETLHISRYVPDTFNLSHLSTFKMLSRSGSCRSLSHIPSSGSIGVTRSAGTQTDTENDKSQESIRRERAPRWRRHARHRRSVSTSGVTQPPGPGRDNLGYTGLSPPSQHSTSLDNLLDTEKQEKKNFLLKYRQVSGDLRASQELVDRSPDAVDEKVARSRSMTHYRSGNNSIKDRSIIESKTVRKEKRKTRHRDPSVEKSSSGLTPALRKVRLEREGHCYTNTAMDTSSDREEEVFLRSAAPPGGLLRAPLASQECDLSPVPAPLSRNMYNASYRLATDPQPGKLPRTSTRLSLDAAPRPAPPSRVQEPVYTVAGPGPIRRFTVPEPQAAPPHHTQTLPPRYRHAPRAVQPPLSSAGSVAPLTRGNVARASLYSVATQDSGHYSQVSAVLRSPSPTAMFKLLLLLLPPSYRRKLQLLLKFIMKISLNQNLRLDPGVTNSALALDTFLEVILRPSAMSRHNRELSLNIVKYLLDHYDQVLTPPQDLRREVEERVYRGLVSRRLEAGEDPYPVTYCEQVTRHQYEHNRLTGSQAAIKDLLEAILRDDKMEKKSKKRKLKKFREAYPDMWRCVSNLFQSTT